MVHQILNVIKQRKTTSIIIVLVLLGGGYYGYKKITTPPAENHYVLAAVQKGALITSVSGTGQIAVSNQVDVKAKASGDIIVVSVVNGQVVKAGTVMARLDAKDAQKTVRDAQANLESAKLSLAKLQQAADPLSFIQAENSLVQANDSKQNSQDALKKAYDDGFNTVANAFIDIPAIMTGVHDILYGYNLSATQNNADYYVNAVTSYNDKIGTFRDAAIAQYQVAKIRYDQSFSDYKTVTRLSDTDILETLVGETYNTTQSAAETVKSITNFIQLYEDALVGRNLKPISTADTQLSALNGYTGKFNLHLANLLTIKNTIADSKTAIASADRTIAEKIESLAKLKAGTNPLDIQSQQLTIKQRINALLDAQEKLADYTVRAPFDGVAAKVNIKKGDSLSSSGSVATLVTAQQIAQISLNEVDVAKIKAGNKVTITFDAVPDLQITGGVAEIDTLGTISQGVVTYNVKIVFDTQDERVKPGMSASATIITDMKQDALFVPNSAIKSQGGAWYVETIDGYSSATNLTSAMKSMGVTSPTQPRQQTVEVGISNDVSTEIIAGLKEGDIVVTRIITPASQKTATQQAPSLFGAVGARGGGGGGGALRGATGR